MDDARFKGIRVRPRLKVEGMLRSTLFVPLVAQNRFCVDRVLHPAPRYLPKIIGVIMMDDACGRDTNGIMRVDGPLVATIRDPSLYSLYGSVSGSKSSLDGSSCSYDSR